MKAILFDLETRRHIGAASRRPSLRQLLRRAVTVLREWRAAPRPRRTRQARRPNAARHRHYPRRSALRNRQTVLEEVMNAIATNFETWTTPGAPAPVRAHPPRKSPLKLRCCSPSPRPSRPALPGAQRGRAAAALVQVPADLTRRPPSYRSPGGSRDPSRRSTLAPTEQFRLWRLPGKLWAAETGSRRSPGLRL